MVSIFFENQWLAWGVGPYFAAIIGYFVPVLCLVTSYFQNKTHSTDENADDRRKKTNKELTPPPPFYNRNGSLVKRGASLISLRMVEQLPA